MPPIEDLVRPTRESRRAIVGGVVATAILAALIVLGSRNLQQFDAALVAYTFGVLFATFGLVYRYVMWLHRPPTAMYWRRGWEAALASRHRAHNVGRWFGRFANDVLLNHFIWSRDKIRGLTHNLIMWGCALAIAITFPLVFGWLMFQTVPGHPTEYQAYVFGFPTFTFPSDSLFAVLAFHGLVIAAFLVIAGVMLAMRRRMRDGDAAALQLFSEDFLPLILLFAVSLTGLMLTASYTWMGGSAFEFVAILHAVTVIFTFLWLPFGKFFHIFQRPAQLAVRFYKDLGRHGDEPAHCARCGHAFTSQMHADDLIEVERALGFRYELEGGGHYQLVCPPCRRSLLAQAQGEAWRHLRGGLVVAPGAAPEHVNPGLGEGPLGYEDRDNFHG
ncbi:MAG: hypothetical protein KC543_10850 [Myxococcales bacterium]|nr:hypothetical protein [Myxococcales bacterium]